VALLDHWSDPETRQIYVVMELAEGGDLPHHVAALQSGGGWSTTVAVRLMVGMARGLEYAHEVGIWHRDIKPDNVLVTGDGRAMLGDFGLARDTLTATAAATMSKGVGSPLWMAPEVLQSKPYTATADVWSLGIVCYQLLVGDMGIKGWPFLDHTSEDIVNWLGLGMAVVNRSPDWSRLPDDTPPSLRVLLSCMLSKDPALRPTAQRVCGVLSVIADEMGGVGLKAPVVEVRAA